ncbi:hypothetical protein JCM19297_3456 [Nonlabens ulvanivorans]|nr:hypothetical protein JCM19297_3456 [Nonlabens ulvanivorans]
MGGKNVQIAFTSLVCLLMGFHVSKAQDEKKIKSHLFR